MNIHCGKKPFICEYPDCGKRFSEKGNMKTHLKTHMKKNLGEFSINENLNQNCNLINQNIQEKSFNVNLHFDSKEAAKKNSQVDNTPSVRNNVNILPCQNESINSEIIKDMKNEKKVEDVNKVQEYFENENIIECILHNDSLSTLFIHLYLISC